jgi:hypothetical protein
MSPRALGVGVPVPRLSTVLDPLHLWSRTAQARDAAADAAGRVVVTAVDRAAGSPRTADVMAVVVRSPLPARAVSDIVDVLLERGVAEQIAERILAGPEIDRLLGALFESPRVAELADLLVNRVLESEELWLIVDRVAQSPAVTTVITQQGAGFANQMADEVAERSRRADDRLERRARRLLRRRTTGVAAPPVTG